MKHAIASSVAAASIAMIAALAGGCGSEESLAGSHTTSTARAPVAAVPSLAEVDRALALDKNDEAVVRQALGEWTRDVEARAAGDKRFVARRGELEFVATVSPSLENDQLARLVDMMLERRDARREQMRGRRGELTPEQRLKLEAHRKERGERRGAPDPDRIARRIGHKAELLDTALELTDEQAARVQAALSTLTDAQMSIRTARRSESITHEQARQRMRAAHDTFQAALKEILTEEQEARLEILQPLFPGRRHHA